MPIIVALVTVAGAVVAPRLNAHPDDLKRAESLTALLAALPPSPQRDLLEQVRGDHAVVWALRQTEQFIHAWMLCRDPYERCSRWDSNPD